MEVRRDKDDIFGQADYLKSGVCYSSLGDGCVHSFQWEEQQQNESNFASTMALYHD